MEQQTQFLSERIGSDRRFVPKDWPDQLRKPSHHFYASRLNQKEREHPDLHKPSPDELRRQYLTRGRRRSSTMLARTHIHHPYRYGEPFRDYGPISDGGDSDGSLCPVSDDQAERTNPFFNEAARETCFVEDAPTAELEHAPLEGIGESEVLLLLEKKRAMHLEGTPRPSKAYRKMRGTRVLLEEENLPRPLPPGRIPKRAGKVTSSEQKGPTPAGAYSLGPAEEEALAAEPAGPPRPSSKFTKTLSTSPDEFSSGLLVPRTSRG